MAAADQVTRSPEPAGPGGAGIDRSRALREHFWAAARRLDAQDRDALAARRSSGNPVGPQGPWRRLTARLRRRANASEEKRAPDPDSVGDAAT